MHEDLAHGGDHGPFGVFATAQRGGDIGADVRVVADGRVVFADWFQGYGRTVIVERNPGFC